MRRVPRKPLPTVLLVHGGPWGRDAWGFDPYHQWLANRGYAVLSVNFRGSTGFGKAFVNAGNLAWGREMHDDLLDAVAWAVEQGVAQQDTAIMGSSYGGYAALAGLTFTPEVFAAGVDVVGPSNLVTLLNAIPPYWTPMLAMLTARVGDPRTEGGPGPAERAFARPLRRAHHQAAPHRPRRERPARQAGRVRQRRGGAGKQRHPGNLRPLPRRGPRLRPARKQPVPSTRSSRRF